MPSRVIQRRLRHIQAINLDNVSLLLHRNSPSSTAPHHEIIKCLPCFFSIESLKGAVLYVSEVRSGISRELQFNELNFDGNSSTKFYLRVIVEFPQEYLNTDDGDGERKWVSLARYYIDMNQLQKYDPVDDIVEEFDVPFFKFFDGYFISRSIQLGREPIMQSEKDNSEVKLMKRKNSFNYNTLLKLNKMFEYKERVELDNAKMMNTMDRLLSEMKRTEFMYDINKNVEESIEKMEMTISRKRKEIEVLKGELESKDRSFENSSGNKDKTDAVGDLHENEEYGGLYSNLIQNRDRLTSVRNRRLVQLVKIFKSIFPSDDDIAVFKCEAHNEDEEDDIVRISLNKLDFRSIRSRISSQNDNSHEIETVNMVVGYYTLFLEIMSRKIFNVRMAYELHYCGSTSLIDSIYPLYIHDVTSVKQLQMYRKAIDLLNIDINQVNEYLKAHYNTI